MWEKNLNQRLILIGVVILLAIFFLIDWGNGKLNLHKGIDIAGGVSLIYEIRESKDAEADAYLAERMKENLTRRVDPDGVYNLVWRVHGSNRIEVQMPLPDRDAMAAQEAYLTAFQALFSDEIERSHVEAAVRQPAAERPAALRALSGGSADREGLLTRAADRYDAHLVALENQRQGPPATQPATTAPDTQDALPPRLTQETLDIRARDAEEALQDAIDAVLATNFPQRRFQDILELSDRSAARSVGIEDLKKRFPGMAAQIQDVLVKHDEWRSHSGLNSPADLKRLLKGAGVLEFRILAEPNPENPFTLYRQQLQDRGPKYKTADYGWYRIDNPIAFFNLDSPRALDTLDPSSLERGSPPLVVDKYGENYYVLAKEGVENGMLRESVMGKAWKLDAAYASRDQQGRPNVIFQLDVVGGDLFSDLTRKNVEKQLCIFVDDVAYSSANIRGPIGRFGSIEGDFNRQKVAYLVRTMEEGSLPGRLKDTPLSERTIESALGATNLHQAFRAGVIGVIAVALTMAVYYMVSGLIANAALILNILLVLAAMAMLHANFTLPGIAGVILTIGMTVDANVLIFERMREEKQRGSSLRMIIKNGYEKAFSTIIDSNITTLLTCVIIYYVGSEEIRGFGLTLGWGIVCSLFTSLFVTRTIFSLLVKYNFIKDIRMLSIIGVPRIDWYAKRRFFIPVSAVIIVGGLSLLITRGARDVLDVEFLGGVNVELETRSADHKADEITDKIKAVGEQIAEQARALAQATVEPVAGEVTRFEVRADGITAKRLAALVTEPLEARDMLVRDGVDANIGGDAIALRVTGETTLQQLRDTIHGLADRKQVPQTAENIAAANVNAIVDTGNPSEDGRIWNVTTTATNKALVGEAILEALGDDLVTRPPISYTLHEDNGRPFPVASRQLASVLPGAPDDVRADLTDYLGGVAIWFDDMNPPQTVEDVRARIDAMRLQPKSGGEFFRSNDFDVFGITRAGQDPDGRETYSSIAVVAVDPDFPYADDPENWYAQFARDEVELAAAALQTEQTFRRVMQFKPQIAGQAREKAIIALVLSWGMIIAYLWIRFGRPMYGVAGVIALIHDVLIALAFIGFSGALAGVAGFLLIEGFRINMTIIAAFLTIIGYSINDTIVIFDRIRETRGRLGEVTPQIINSSINQCMARTLLTSATTLLVLLVMYIFGGSSIRGFNYCMIVGILTGTYSSIAIASPLLMIRLIGRRAARPARAAPAPA